METQPLTAMLSEEELVSLLRSGDTRSVSYLYEHYSKALMAVIYKIVRSTESAEEILQETFVRIWQNAKTYDGSKGRLYTWMLTIARNLAVDRSRSAEYKSAGQTETINGNVHTLNQSLKVEIVPEHIDLKQLTERLRPEQKELIDLIYFYGYTQADAAAKLKIPLGTVKTRVRTAISELRKFFAS